MRTVRWTLFAVVVSAALCPHLRAHVIAVDCEGGGDYTTVQEAVEAASNGDTIAVAPCTYQEQVTVAGKCLVFEGAGASSTVMSSAASSGVLVFESMPAPYMSVIRRFGIVQELAGSPAIRWDEHGLDLEECMVTGSLEGGDSYALADAYVRLRYCQTGDVDVEGGGVTSVVDESSLGRAGFAGVSQVPWVAPHHVVSSNSTYEAVSTGLVEASFSHDVLGSLLVEGAYTSPGPTIQAEQCTLGWVSAFGNAGMEFVACVLRDSLWYWDTNWPANPLTMSGCHVAGSLSLRLQTGGAFNLTHNTILGRILYEGSSTNSEHNRMRSNIVVAASDIDTGGDAAVISHNDFVGEATIVAPSGSAFANFSENPLFCDAPAGDYTLENCSPCIGAGHDGGDVGAFGSGCSCATVVSRATWGGIKAAYRAPR